jgi:hypothetical protein
VCLQISDVLIMIAFTTVESGSNPITKYEWIQQRRYKCLKVAIFGNFPLIGSKHSSSNSLWGLQFTITPIDCQTSSTILISPHQGN